MAKLSKILVTKKLNQQWVDKAAQMNLVLCPVQFLKFEYMPMQPFSIWNSSAFIFTSANGVEGFNRCLTDFGIEWNADRIYFSTSGATKLALVEKGLEKLNTSKNAESLANLIQEHNIQQPGLTYFYFTCKQRLNTLEIILSQSNINLDIIEVYSKEIIPTKIDFNYDAIIFYSPSQIEAFLINNLLNPEIPVYCIGETTGNMARKKGFENINIANEPTTECLIELIGSQK